MVFRHRVTLAALLACLAIPPAAAQIQMREDVDLDAVYRIKDEGLTRSEVMDIASYLTDVYGPRLTGSPAIKEAADWAQNTMRSWGLSNVHVERFPFGRGWENRRIVAQAVSPRAYPLIAYPKAWTPGTSGPVTGAAVLVSIQNEGDFSKFKGTLRGKFVLATPMRSVAARFEPLARRYTNDELDTLATQPAPRPRAQPAPTPNPFARRLMQFWIDEGVAAVLEPGQGDGGTVFVQGGGSRNASDPPVPPQIVLAVEHYGRIARTLDKKVPVTLMMDVDNRFLDEELNAFNVIAEVPGSDNAGEVVMLGAHFDSWHTGTGATDNAAGSAVMMEAMRILKRSGVPLRRTVRVALWGGEEQGLLGSRAYATEHFGDRTTMVLKPEHAAFSTYFNVDNGTGAIRGVYLQGNEAAAPVFKAWMEPFRNMGMTTLTIRNTTGTDHLAFDEVGLPGFQFVQDPVEYNSRTHHSNADAFERLQPQDMMQNAVIVAAFAVQAANREERLPRKPLPAPAPPPRPTSQGR